MSETPRRTEFTQVARESPPQKRTHFELHRRHHLLGARSVLTLEGKMHRGTFARAVPVAALYLSLATLAESFTIFNWLPAHIGYAIGLHALTLILVITHAALIRRIAPSTARMLVAFAPVPLIRIVSLTSPLREFTYIQWFSVIAIILYAGIVTAIKLLNADLPSLGLQMPRLKHFPLEAAVIVGGFALGFTEYLILRPGAIVQNLSARDLIAPILVIYVSTGLLEELLFRGLLQRYAGEAMGTWRGIAFVTLVFAALHAGWVYATPWAWLDLLFVAAVGLAYSIVRRKTGSIVGISISHGITNSMLFLVMPYTWPWLGPLVAHAFGG